MSDVERRDRDDGGETVSPVDVVPHGNLFDTPKLTALDPANRTERRNVERLLEALDESG